ncbi:MAG: LytR/AlgR family response regulator transcription factor, partial [Catonella sp.]
EQGKYDLILMDIYMDSELTGVEVIRLIREKDKNIPVAFVTTSKEHTLESYRLSAIKYIEKPYSKESIEDTLYLALLKKQDVPSLLVQKNRSIQKIPFADIIYIEQQVHKIFICINNNEDVYIYGKLSDLNEQLPEEQFFIPHKSFVVNLSFVRYIDTELKCFAMGNHTNVPIRRELLTKAKNTLENYLFDSTRGLMN